MYCTACGRPVTLASSLTDYHVAAAVTDTDGRIGTASTAPCVVCDGTGIVTDTDGTACTCITCAGSGRSYTEYNAARRVCLPCARGAFHYKIQRRTGRVCDVPRRVWNIEYCRACGNFDVPCDECKHGAALRAFERGAAVTP